MGCQFFKIFDEQRLEYVLLADGETEDVYMLGKIAAFQIQSLLVAIRSVLTKITLSKIFFWTTFFWLIFTIVQRNYILTQK